MQDEKVKKAHFNKVYKILGEFGLSESYFLIIEMRSSDCLVSLSGGTLW